MRNPGITKERIERPIFITGMPRSDSSFLLDVMAKDPANRVARNWEILQPSPPPTEATYADDPRIDIAQRLLEEQGFTDPDVMAAHPFGTKLPEECSFIMEHSFIAGNLAAFVNAKQYGAWLSAQADHGMAYAFHRRFLQHLQWRYRRQHWVLKAPPHMFHLQALMNEYPDALVIMTHRDLMKVLPSVSSLATALKNVFCAPGTVDPIATGKDIVKLLSGGVRHTMKTRDRLARPQQFFDVLYTDLRNRPIETIERIYAHFRLPFSEEARQAMTAYIQEEGKARHGHGRHRYSMSDYGFTETDIDSEFSGYIQCYGVSKEG